MDNYKMISDQFKYAYEEFINACDAEEDKKKWDLEQYGQMEGYFTGDLMCVITYLAAIDGQITEVEAKELNKILGIEYTTEELKNIYADCKENIDNIVENGLQDSLNMLRSINPNMAKAYKNLLVYACKLIVASDRLVATEENEIIQKIYALD